jgi:hypothetical protein
LSGASKRCRASNWPVMSGYAFDRRVPHETSCVNP